MTDLFSEVYQAVTSIQHGWTSVTKAQTMAAMVVAFRPEISVEIGVYAGKGLLSLALAHKAINHGFVIGIDPWDAKASAEGQVNKLDEKFWSLTDHNAMADICMDAIAKYDCMSFVDIQRKRSDQFLPPDNIGLLRIDGNHGEQAMKDALRYSPKMKRGGVLILDDVGWSGGATDRAAAYLKAQGWLELYKLDDGLVFLKP